MKQITDEEASALLTLKMLSGEIPEQGELSAEQIIALDEWLDAVEGRREAISTGITLPEIIAGIQERMADEPSGDRIKNYVQQAIHGDDVQKANSRKILSRLFRLRNIAAIVIVSIVGFLLVHLMSKSSKHEVAIMQAPPIVPAKGNVQLKLSTGEVITLGHTNISVTDGNTKFLALDGELQYHSGKADLTKYNLLTTGVAQMFKVKLSDGTVVWLNAGTTLKYPLQFGTTERLVEIEGGEGFFDVAHSSVPFRVKTGNEIIEVHGTAFNVSAYSGEAKKISLVRGAVRVYNKAQQIDLSPGEQVCIAPGIFQKRAAIDMDEVQAWLSNHFWWNNKTVKETLSDISRWYGVEIVYDYTGPLLNARLHGLQVPRENPANATLELIAFTTKLNIYYSDKKIIIRQ